MYERQRQGTVDVIRCTEALIEEHLDDLETLLAECLHDGQPHAVINLEMVPMIDSQGLERLLDARDLFERTGGALKLAAPNELCREILACTGVGERFEVYADVKPAVGSFAQ